MRRTCIVFACGVEFRLFRLRRGHSLGRQLTGDMFRMKAESLRLTTHVSPSAAVAGLRGATLMPLTAKLCQNSVIAGEAGLGLKTQSLITIQRLEH